MEGSYLGKEVLVTGGAGFIGSHIVEKLLEAGAIVTVLDNLSSGSIENLNNVINKIKFINDDIRNVPSCFIATKNKEIIFHCAAFVSVAKSVENPSLCYDINMVGTYNLLYAAVQNRVKNFVLSSSAAVYGEKQTSCKETDIPSPMSPYAHSKLACEMLCKEFSKIYEINSVVLRYFNVYGNRQNPTGEYAAVVAKFKERLINKKPLTIFGNGFQSRDFINVSCVAQANLALGLHNFRGEIFNIASGFNTNLFSLIDFLKNEFSIDKAEIDFQPERAGDIFTSIADCNKFKEFASRYISFEWDMDPIKRFFSKNII